MMRLVSHCAMQAWAVIGVLVQVSAGRPALSPEANGLTL